MDRLRERLILARQAVGTLEELVHLVEPTRVERDAAVQRFEYTFEATWKAARRFLQVLEGLDVGSPKGVVRASREIGLLTSPEAEHALRMTDDRNLVAHTYNEGLAQAIFARIPGHLSTLHAWLGAMESRLL